jgi:hypothetical protein
MKTVLVDLGLSKQRLIVQVNRWEHRGPTGRLRRRRAPPMTRTLAAFVALSLLAAPLVIPMTAHAWDGGSHRGHRFHPGPFHPSPFHPGHFHPGHFHPGPFHPGHFQHDGCCFFGGFAAGVFTGAAVGGAFAPVYAYPAPVYASPAPVYAAPPPTYWYYCRSLGAYYPYVPNCPEPWVPVLA